MTTASWAAGRRCLQIAARRRAPLFQSPRAASVNNFQGVRLLSSSSTQKYDEPVFENFEPKPPSPLTVDMAEGIASATQFYVRHGVAHQRLTKISQDDEMPAVIKWQKMMEVFLTTQVHVIVGLGYGANEQGLGQYAKDLAGVIESADDTMRELFSDVRRDTWRDLVSTCFKIDKDDIPTLSIVDARNLMHKVSSKMIEPDTLLEIQTLTAKIEDSDPEVEVAKKHQLLQHVIVNRVYLGGNPSLVEEAGFGNGAQAYAKMQCAMSDHEGDPLIAQYASAAMMRIWEAAGLDISSIQGAGLPNAGATP